MELPKVSVLTLGRIGLFVILAHLVSVISAGLAAQDRKAPVYYFNPDWSPDGRTLVFESTKDGRSAIYIINFDGTGLRRLTDPVYVSGQPRWSRDGKRIVLYAEVDGNMQIFLMKRDGSELRRVTTSATLDYLPDLSPRGNSVVFQSRAERPAVAHDIFVIGADGAGTTRLTDGSHGYTSPKWSPDGKRIVFVRARIPKKYYREMSREELKQMKDSEEIVVMNADGSHPVDLTENTFNDSSPHWSRSGKAIFFMSDRDGSPAVYVMNADGTAQRKLADGRIVTNPFVSPDEKYIAYTKEVAGKWGLYIYEIKSESERLLIGN